MLVGNLTIHGVEKQVSWDTTVTLVDGVITGTATTQVTFDEFEIEKPVIGPVMSIEDEVDLTIDIVAEPARSYISREAGMNIKRILLTLAVMAMLTLIVLED